MIGFMTRRVVQVHCLLKVAKKVPNKKVAIYGQERNGATHSLALMNMYLHGIDDAKIEWGDTLANPLTFRRWKINEVPSDCCQSAIFIR